MAKHTKEAGKSAQAAALAKLAKAKITDAMPILSRIVGEQEAAQERQDKFLAAESQEKTGDSLQSTTREWVDAEQVRVEVLTISANSAPDTLLVKKLDPRAILPTVHNPGEDLGYDIYALDTVRIGPGETATIKTGIAAFQEGHGLLVQDRSSMAKKGMFISGGVIDAGYRGELTVVLTNHRFDTYIVYAYDKVAQMIPLPVLTGKIVDVGASSLPTSARGEAGFGSSGR